MYSFLPLLSLYFAGNDSVKLLLAELDLRLFAT